MTAEELRKAIDRTKMTVEEFAEAIGKDKRTIYRWLSGQTPVPKYVKLLLK